MRNGIFPALWVNRGCHSHWQLQPSAMVNWWALRGLRKERIPAILLLFSHTVVSDTLLPHGLQHSRLPCPSLSPGVCSNSCPLSWWCHPTISSSVVPYSSCPQSFPASGSFPRSWLFASGGQSIGVLTLASVLPMIIQCWFPLGLIGLISLQSKGLSRVFSRTIVWKHQFFGTQPSWWSNTHIHRWLALIIQTFVSKVMSLLFNMLSRFVIAFLLRSKCLLISWLQSQSAVILEPKKIKSVTVSIFFPSICHECGWCASLGKVAPVILGGECTVNHRLQLPMTMTSSVFPSICHGQMPWSSFLNVEFEASFFTLLFNLFLFSSRGSSISFCFLPLGWCHLHIWDYCCFTGNLDSSLCFICHLAAISPLPLPTVSREETHDVKTQATVPDSWGAYERNNFIESRFLHLPIHRKARNSLTWDIWFPFINNNLLMFRLPSLSWKNFYITWILPSFPQNSSPSVTWDAVSRAWNPKNSLQVKHSFQLLGCNYFLSPQVSVEGVKSQMFWR